MATIGFDDSILSSIKSLMPNSGVPADYNVFDTELIGDINAELAILFQLGVGETSEMFYITGTSETWGEFLKSPELLQIVPQYVAIRVKILFDPPKSSIVMDSLNERARELSFRLQDAAKRELASRQPTT